MSRILISAGPTRERLDPVRFLSNRSSGKMGYALAFQAAQSGHQVTLISGPVSLPTPENVQVINVESAKEMFDAIRQNAQQMDVIIMAAAVADYRPKIIENQKIKKSDGTMTLELERTDDILMWLGKHKLDGQILVGFAAETQNLAANARKKLIAKNVDYIIANDVSKPDRGFGSDNNAVTIFSKDSDPIEISVCSKEEVAKKILELVIQ